MPGTPSHKQSPMLRGKLCKNWSLIALAAAVCALSLSFGCASHQVSPAPAVPKPAPVAMRMPSPQQLMREQIEGVMKNPRFTAEDKANMIRRIKSGQMGVSAADPKTPVNQNAHR